MTYCPSPTSISTWASAPAVAPTARANPIPKATRGGYAQCVMANELRIRSRRGMAVLLVVRDVILLVGVIVTRDSA